MRAVELSLWLAVTFGAGGCTGVVDAPTIAYPPESLRRELERRVGADAAAAIPILYRVPDSAVRLARERVARAPRGSERIEALAVWIAAEEGLGIRYRWDRSSDAATALALGEGNCLSMAAVLVGLARALGWQAYFAEAGFPREEEAIESGFRVLSDHLVVVVEAEGARAVVDFLGRVDGRALRLIDDLRATSHLLNNRAFQRVADAESAGRAVSWEDARDAFLQATRIDPRSARAWNNLGIALARLGEASEARRALMRARLIDASLDSPLRNLEALQTRTDDRDRPVRVSPLPTASSESSAP